MSRKGFLYTILFVSPIVGIVLWSNVSMNWSQNTCAEILRIERSRGYYVWMRFERNNNIVEDNVLLSNFKYHTLKDLKSKKCCNIRYSIYWPYSIEIIDKELGAE